MRIDVVAVGKLKERFWREACAEYGKRLVRYVDVRTTEVDDRDPARCGGEAGAMRSEGEDVMRILGKMPSAPATHVVCLDIGGKQFSSEELAQFVEQRSLEGCKDLVFVIGGSSGIDPAVKAQAQTLLSFGKITMPHNLARVVLLEQLYRAYKIIRGEPYHK